MHKTVTVLGFIIVASAKKKTGSVATQGDQAQADNSRELFLLNLASLFKHKQGVK